MASLVLGWWLPPDQEETWRRLYQEVEELRRADYEHSRQRLGITREQAWIVPAPPGALLLTCLEAEQTEPLLAALLSSTLPFDTWFRTSCQRLYSLDGRCPLAWPPHLGTLIFAWSAT